MSQRNGHADSGMADQLAGPAKPGGRLGAGAGMEYQGRKIRVNNIDMNVVIAGEGQDVLLVHAVIEKFEENARRAADMHAVSDRQAGR